MINFIIKKLVISGDNVPSSEVIFSDSLTIISGRSNTGKTIILQCIDYIFGGSMNPLTAQPEYNKIILELYTHDGELTLERLTDSNKIDVISNHPNIQSGVYGAKHQSTNYVGDLLLKLIGIEREVRIIKNRSFATQKLGWRTFWHMLYVNETNILKEGSILLPENNTNKTSFLSSLIFLLTNEDFSFKTELESDEAKKIRQNSLQQYINKNLSGLVQKQVQLDRKEKSIDSTDLNNQIKYLTSDLELIQNQIENTSKEVNELNNLIIINEKEISETELLIERYNILLSQYNSDIKRLDFILEEDHIHVENQRCPFCDNSFKDDNNIENLREASEYELEKIILMVDDLQSTIISTAGYLEKLHDEQKEKYLLLQDLEKLINEDLHPRASSVKQSIELYTEYSSIKNELEFIKNLINKYNSDLKKLKNEKTREENYRPIDEFSNDFFNDLENILFDILSYCQYPNLVNVEFDKSTFDIKINGRSKASQGKGFRSLLNTIVILTIRQYTLQYGDYKIGPFLIDTPLLGLDEESENSIENDIMAKKLFEYIIHSRNLGQIIIIENTNNLPDINFNFAGVEHIKFTKNRNFGRYGLLISVED